MTIRPTSIGARSWMAAGAAVAGILGLAACSSGAQPSPAATETSTATATVTETPAPIEGEREVVGSLTAPQAWGLCYALTVKGNVLGGSIEAPLFADAIVEPRPDDTWFVGFNADVSPGGIALAEPGRAWCLLSGPPENFTDVAHAEQVGLAAEDLDPQAPVDDIQWTVDPS